jgi:DNA-directed RNA polymerase subunit alpha
MIKTTCIETFIDKNYNYYSSFIIEPLENGYAITLGNSLRRTLLSSIHGFAITAMKINNISHEFSLFQGIKEDIMDIIFNVKNIIFKTKTNFIKSNSVFAFIYIRGPILVSSGMFKLPKNTLQIVNPFQHICTINNNLEFFIEILIEKGKYSIIQNKEQINSDIQVNNITNILIIDNNFESIKKVNYKTKIIHDSYGNLRESIFLEIITNGSITPKRALQTGFKILLHLFFPLINCKLMNKLTKKFKTKIIKRLQFNNKIIN